MSNIFYFTPTICYLISRVRITHFTRKGPRVRGGSMCERQPLMHRNIKRSQKNLFLPGPDTSKIKMDLFRGSPYLPTK